MSTTTHPGPRGAPPQFRLDFTKGLPADADWATAIQERHTKDVRTYARMIDNLADVREGHEQAERDFRGDLREAMMAGKPLPPRPADLDPDVLAAAITIAEQHIDDVREVLAGTVVEALGIVRAHRSELDFSALSAGLLGGLTAGAGNAREALREKAQRKLRALEVPGGIVDVSDPSQYNDDLEAA